MSAEITDIKIANAARNEYDASFVLGGRTFPIKDLGYDDYIEFIKLSKPVVEAVLGAVSVATDEHGEAQVNLEPTGVDFDALIDMAGTNLPRLAWMCCRQSDTRITVDEVKRLARRPMELMDVVLAQIKHNQIVEELAKFFPRLVTSLTTLAPSSMTGETR